MTIQAINPRVAYIRQCLDVLKVRKVPGQGFDVVQLNLETGTIVEVWSDTFTTRAAAELFRHDLADAAADGKPNSVRCSSGYVRAYEAAARALH